MIIIKILLFGNFLVNYPPNIRLVLEIFKTGCIVAIASSLIVG
ncbi:hypothetical protein [Nostoc sp. NIES-3756]|nr:hypothetical protein [Nostoc sp. NIES-3756]